MASVVANAAYNELRKKALAVKVPEMAREGEKHWVALLHHHKLPNSSLEQADFMWLKGKGVS
jgi:hypothetical protein